MMTLQISQSWDTPARTSLTRGTRDNTTMMTRVTCPRSSTIPPSDLRLSTSSWGTTTCINTEVILKRNYPSTCLNSNVISDFDLIFCFNIYLQATAIVSITLQCIE